MRNQEREHLAALAADYLRARLRVDPGSNHIGLVLGTGWGGSILGGGWPSCPFQEIPGMPQLEALPGHARQVVAGVLGGVPVVALNGRVHLNEDPWRQGDILTAARLQVEMLFHLGVRTLVLTCAAGALPGSEHRVGDVVPVRGFMTLAAPPMPLTVGEFISPEDNLDPNLREKGRQVVQSWGRDGVRQGVYAMVNGPFFEGRLVDKQALANYGATLVGMSCLPEVCIAALYGVRVLMLAFVSNSATEDHSHDTNTARLKARSGELGVLLERIVGEIAE